KLVRELAGELNLDVSKAGVYTMLFNRVLSAHPELAGQQPNRSYSFLQRQNLRTGNLTPARRREGTSGSAGPIDSALHPAVKYNAEVEKQFAVQGTKSQG